MSEKKTTLDGINNRLKTKKICEFKTAIKTIQNKAERDMSDTK